MTIHARFLPKYPKDVRVKDGLTKAEVNGVLTLGFDYANSEFGAELQQAVDTANADATATAADRIATGADKTAAQTAATEAQSWADLAESAVVNVDASFDLVADAQAATIGASKKTILTQGYTVIGKGGARYQRVATQPTHPGKLRSTDRFLPDGTTDATNGGWWEIVEPVIDVRMLGFTVGANGDTEFANAIATAGALSVPLGIPKGSGLFTKKIDISPLLDGASQIILTGNFTADFTGATDIGQFPSNAFVVIDAGALVTVGALGGDFAKASRAFSILSPAITPGPGDILCLYNSADGSYNAAKASYRVSELAYTASYSAGIVSMAGSLRFSYPAATTTVYKHPAKRLTITGGKFYIKESTNAAFDSMRSLYANRLAFSDLSAFVPTNPANSGMSLNQCIGMYGSGYHIEQNRHVGSDNYGMVISNCQDMFMSGNFTALKHPVTIGGEDSVGAIVNTSIYITGTFRNIGPTPAGVGYAAVNCHGNAEGCYFGGLIDGAVSMGGNKNGILPGSTIVARQDSYGVAILLVDIVGHDFKFENLDIYADGDPNLNSSSTIDIGQSGYGANANTKYGGTISFAGTRFSCPTSLRPFSYTNRGYTGSEKVTISFEGATFKETLAGSPIFIIQTVAGRDIDVLNLNGFDNIGNLTYSTAGVDKVRGWRQTGSVTLAPSTSASVVTASQAINAPKTPVVSLSNVPVTMGGARCYPYVDATTTASSVVIGMATNDGASFPSSAGGTLGFTATLDE